MKRTLYILIAFLAVAFTVTSCSLESDTVAGDGDMEGMWHLERVTLLAKDSTGQDSTVDYSNQRIFWSFQHKLLQLRDYDGDSWTLLCRFNISGGQLSLSEFTHNTRAHDEPVTDVTKLAPYRLYSLTPSFSYTIDGSKLTLRTDSTTMNFKRF